MGFYRKKPIVIEAFKWTGDEHQTEDPDWMCDALREKRAWFNNIGTEEVTLEIETLEGNHKANRGDWIIKGVKGELYPCKDDIFRMTYGKVNRVTDKCRLCWMCFFSPEDCGETPETDNEITSGLYKGEKADKCTGFKEDQ